MVSILNGLSQMGAGVAQYAANAGAEAQKADLNQQAITLAANLATARETGLQQGQQQFEAGQTTQKLAAAADIAAQQRASEEYRTKLQVNAPPDTLKLLRAFGVPLPGDGAAASTPSISTSAAAAPTTAGATAGTTSAVDVPAVSAPATSTAIGQTTAVAPMPSNVTGNTSSSAPSPTAAALSRMDPFLQELAAKAMGVGLPGSDAQIRIAIANDVRADPQFRYKSEGAQAMEVATRLAVADGKMTDPASRAEMARAIAGYQLPPLSGYAMMKPGGPETMGLVTKINQDYQASRYPEISEAVKAFGPGPLGDRTQFLDTGVQHMALLDKAATALDNGDVQVLNSIKQAWNTQFGSPVPTNFNALKDLVAAEVQKAVTGGLGTGGERDQLVENLKNASSGRQIQGVTDSLRGLMAGQLNALKQRYESDTGFKSGPFMFDTKLQPETLSAIRAHDINAQPGTTPKPPAVGDTQMGYTFKGGDPANPASWEQVK